MKSQGNVKSITIHPKGNMNVCETSWQYIEACGDISFNATNVNLIVVPEEKPWDRQTR